MNELLQNRRMRGAILFSVLALAAYLFVLTVNEIKQFGYIGAGISAANVITVSGEGEVFAVPDIGTFSFSVQAENEVAATAQSEAAEKVNAIIAYLKDNGVEEKDIKTVNYSFYPRYEYPTERSYYPPTGERTFVGFEVNQSVEVKVRDTKETGTLVSGVGELGATNVSGINFTIDDDDALRAEARENAIKNAEEKAEELADQLDVRLVRVVSFSEGYGGNVYKTFSEAADTAYGIGGAVAPEIPVGENRIVSNVTVTYEIR